MKYIIDKNRILFKRNSMIYGHFLEHFHRQIYGGVYDPTSPLSDKDGLRKDVIEALKEIQTPIIRWPGGCFVSSYHWKKAVGKNRIPSFDKAWRVEDPNTFGTDEFIKLCQKINCEPYICTNAGTGTNEEMSDWVEYCNLESEGEFAKNRIKNGFVEPYRVKYWSVGNENYGGWEIGAKSSLEWSRLVLESTKMMKKVDPTISLSAAALDDVDWNIGILKNSADHIEWISIHKYWNALCQNNTPANYEICMGYTSDLGNQIKRVRGLLSAMGLENQIRIAVDEWNLRGWHHPNTHTRLQGVTKEEYLYPRDENDINSTYTMADAVFSACFLNECLRNADIVGMANFAPIVNTRGAIFTHEKGIVRRTTFYVFKMFATLLGDEILDCYCTNTDKYLVDNKEVDTIDLVALKKEDTVTISAVNKHHNENREITLLISDICSATMYSLCGNSIDDYNDIGCETVIPFINNSAVKILNNNQISITLPPHSVNIIILQNYFL